MKKIILVLFVLTSLSCGKKGAPNPLNPMGNCTGLSEAYVSAMTTYTSNPTKQSCEAFIKSLDELVNKCSILNADQKKEYRKQRNEIVCN